MRSRPFLSVSLSLHPVVSSSLYNHPHYVTANNQHPTSNHQLPTTNFQFTPIQLLLIALAGMAGGAVNALAGGGTLITFPVLTAVGIPPVAASITNTVALSPGYFGATLGQLKDIRGQGTRLKLLLPAGAIGGIVGGVLLLNTTDKLFRELVPVSDLDGRDLVGLAGSPARVASAPLG